MRDKVVIITGASSGIGEATARLLAKSGAQLVLGARRVDRLAAIAAEIEEQGGTAIAAQLDVTSRTSVEAFVEQACNRFGRVDVLVNNAGVMLLAPVADLRTDEWDRMIDVNIRGVLYGAAAVLPRMQAQGQGHIITIGSVAGHRVMPMSAVYSATKFAVRAFAEGLRLEGGTAIRSTLISPGAVATELFDKILHPEIQQMAKSRIDDALPVDSIARAIAFAIEQPAEVDVNEIIVRPLANKY
ncbi:MAG: putative oxidoreductase [Bradyrhizobium sp.]|nr:putative oxidoreductase [Bradyrhizobium sp.]